MRLALRKKHIIIFLVIFIVLSLFYAVLFLSSRIQHLHHTLDDENLTLSNRLQAVVHFDNVSTQRQMMKFVDFAKYLENLYNSDLDALRRAIANDLTYDFLRIKSIDGTNLFQSQKPWNLPSQVFPTDAMSAALIFDESAKKTYRAFAYPIIHQNRTEAFIVAYLEVDFLYDFYNLHLLSKDGFVLNETNENLGFVKNLSLLYYDEWREISASKGGQIITPNGVFTFALVDNHIYNVNGLAFRHIPYYLISIIPLNPADNPHFINSIASLIKHADFGFSAIYWIIAYVWIFLSSLIIFYVVLTIIRNNDIASIDDLTSVFNRRSGFKRINRLVRESRLSGMKRKIVEIIVKFVLFRQITRHLHLCVVDIDNLKQVNDTLGHKYGDEMISAIAECLKSGLNRGEFVIRMGGDEFAVILLNRSLEDIESYWHSVQEALRAKNKSLSRYSLRVSHGIVDYDMNADILSSFIRADEIMYQEKRLHKVNLFFN